MNGKVSFSFPSVGEFVRLCVLRTPNVRHCAISRRLPGDLLPVFLSYNPSVVIHSVTRPLLCALFASVVIVFCFICVRVLILAPSWAIFLWFDTIILCPQWCVRPLHSQIIVHLFTIYRSQANANEKKKGKSVQIQLNEFSIRWKSFTFVNDSSFDGFFELANPLNGFRRSEREKKTDHIENSTEIYWKLKKKQKVKIGLSVAYPIWYPNTIQLNWWCGYGIWNHRQYSTTICFGFC